MITHHPHIVRRTPARRALLRAGLVLGLSSLVPLSAHAATTPAFVAEGARSVPGGRAVEVTVGQAEIRSNISSSMAVAGGFGLLGAVVGSNIDSSRAKVAETTISPLRDALLDFDTDGLAVSATRSALATVDWMQPVDIKVSKDPTTLGMGSFLDASDAAQGAFFNYDYEMSADFSTIKVVLSIQFANKALAEGASKPESRFAWGKLAYAQTLVSNIALPAPAATPDANAQLWAAGDGKLAKQALTLAFSNIQTLIPRTLALSESDISALNDKAKVKETTNGYTGRVQEKTDGHVLLWANSFVETDTLPQAQQ